MELLFNILVIATGVLVAGVVVFSLGFLVWLSTDAGIAFTEAEAEKANAAKRSS